MRRTLDERAAQAERATLLRLIKRRVEERFSHRRDPHKLSRWIEHLKFAFDNRDFLKDEEEGKFYLVERRIFIMNYGLSESEMLHIIKVCGGHSLVGKTEYIDMRSILAFFGLLPEDICNYFREKQ